MSCPICSENHKSKKEAEHCLNIVNRWKIQNEQHRKIEGLPKFIDLKTKQFETYYSNL